MTWKKDYKPIIHHNNNQLGNYLISFNQFKTKQIDKNKNKTEIIFQKLMKNNKKNNLNILIIK